MSWCILLWSVCEQISNNDNTFKVKILHLRLNQTGWLEERNVCLSLRVGGLKLETNRRSQSRNRRHRNQWHNEVPTSKTFVVGGKGRHSRISFFFTANCSTTWTTTVYFKKTSHTNNKLEESVWNHPQQHQQKNKNNHQEQEFPDLDLNLEKCSPLLLVKPLARCLCWTANRWSSSRSGNLLDLLSASSLSNGVVC